MTISALHIACSEGNLEKVQSEIDSSPDDINAIDSNFFTPLHIACKFDHKEIAQILIESGADINGKFDNKIILTDPPLHLATTKNNIELVKFLLKNGADINTKNHINLTALHIACFLGFEDIAKELIAQGADVNGNSNPDLEIKIETPLHLANLKKNTTIIQLLLSHGADINAIDQYGWKPSDYAKEENLTQGESLETRFINFSYDDSHPDIQNKNNQTLLFYATRHSFIEPQLIKYLLEKGADINTKDKYGCTPLFYAVKNNNFEVAHLLLEKGANPSGILEKLQNESQEDFLIKEDLKCLLKKTQRVDLDLNNIITQGYFELFQSALDVLKSLNLRNRIDHFREDGFLFNMIKGDSDASRKISILKSLSKEGFDIYKTDSNNDNILTLALKKGDKKLIEEILKEANGFDLTKLLEKKIESVQPISSCFSCLSSGMVLTIAFSRNAHESAIKPPVEISLGKKFGGQLIAKFENRQTASASLGFIGPS